MSDLQFMRLALRLARRGYGLTSPNPMVGAVLVKGGKIIGRGWHRRAGLPHAEIEALHNSLKLGHNSKGATLYVTLEPCCTHGRTPPCTDAIIAAGIKRVVIGATDPNPKHAGKGFRILRRAGIKVDWWGELPREPKDKLKHGSSVASPHQKIAEECARLNEAFNHWIVRRTPFVTVKAAMTLDGKIATANGESKWITGEKARAHGMKLRQGSDAILAGINTILADDPGLTIRSQKPEARSQNENTRLRRIVLDSMARTPLTAKIVSDEHAALTTIVVSKAAPEKQVAALAKKANVIVAPAANSKFKTQNLELDLSWLLEKLGAENVTSLLVEGGGEVNASFLLGGFAQRVAFFYAPKILGGRDSRKGVAGDGAKCLMDAIQLREIEWRKLGEDLLLTARVEW
ncbi:MAG: bifunctional diaminohydroxyphosphoribosylaminopyrimidine deaminase/5-amino-6-(5-phosphoribosylamino)uracil reductase RibD [Limisphaerales bacterium]